MRLSSRWNRSIKPNKHIEIRPQKCGAKPCVVGTRIRVWDIYLGHELQGRSPEQIIHDFPQLNPADVHATLAYLGDHKEEM